MTFLVQSSPMRHLSALATLAGAVLFLSFAATGEAESAPSRVVITPREPATPAIDTPQGVARVWVLPGLEAPQGPRETGMACIYVTNLGGGRTTVSARAVSRAGGTDPGLDADLTARMGTFEAGEQKHVCLTANDPEPRPAEFGSFWMVVTASEPVSAYAIQFGAGSAYSVQGIPVDCLSPPAGLDGACRISAGLPLRPGVVVRPRPR